MSAARHTAESVVRGLGQVRARVPRAIFFTRRERGARRGQPSNESQGSRDVASARHTKERPLIEHLRTPTSQPTGHSHRTKRPAVARATAGKVLAGGCTRQGHSTRRGKACLFFSLTPTPAVMGTLEDGIKAKLAERIRHRGPRRCRGQRRLKWRRGRRRAARRSPLGWPPAPRCCAPPSTAAT